MSELEGEQDKDITTLEQGNEQNDKFYEETAISDDQEQNNELEEEVLVCQLSSNSSFRVPVILESNVEISAVVDTAAEVTLISEEVLRAFPNCPPVLRKIRLNTAGKGLAMTGCIVGPVELKIGDLTTQENLYVAPIRDDMLLGLDFMRKHGVTIDIPQALFSLGQALIPMEDPQNQAKVCEVLAAKTTVVPAHSRMFVKGKLTQNMSVFCIEQTTADRLFIPRMVYDRGKEALVCVLNLDDSAVVIKANSQVAEAHEVTIIPEVKEDLSARVRVEQVQAEDIEGGVPEQLRDLLKRATEHLDPQQAQEVQTLLLSYEDVFAESEFDLGNFTEIGHMIETGDARPVKQRMRRTPVGFAGEEKAHLDKMLRCGVIKPSHSDWSSAC